MRSIFRTTAAAVRSPTTLVLAVFFAVSYASFGVRDTMYLDDHWCIQPPNDFVAEGEDPGFAELAGRIWRATGVNRFPTHLILHTVFPALQDAFWIVHLAVILNHALNTWLAYRFVRRATGGAGTAYLAAALFAFWPTQCEVMFWASTFNYHVGMTLLLTAGLLWLRGTREAGLVAARAWPVLPVVFLTTQFNEQAATAAIALAALTIFLPAPRAPADPHAKPGASEPDSWEPSRMPAPAADAAPVPAFGAEARAAVGRFLFRSLYLCAPVAVWAVLYLTLLRPEAMSATGGRVLKGRYEPTPLSEIPRKAWTHVRTHLRFLPGMTYGQQQIGGSIRRLPEMAGEFPATWWVFGILIGLGVAAAAFDRRRADADVDLRRLAGTAAFAVLMWLFALAPLIATRENWPTVRLGYVGGLGQAVAGGIVLSLIWRTVDGSAFRAAAARVGFAGILLFCTLCNAVEGWQYLRQHRLDLSHAAQVRRQFGGDAVEPKFLLLCDVPAHSQPLTFRQMDHIVNVWAYPWVARPFLRRELPDTHVEYFQTGYAGETAFDAQRLLDNWERLYVFRFPRPNKDRPLTGRPPTYDLTPAAGVHFITAKGAHIARLRLPRMSPVRDTANGPLPAVRVILRNPDAVRIPSELKKYEF